MSQPCAPAVLAQNPSSESNSSGSAVEQPYHAGRRSVRLPVDNKTLELPSILSPDPSMTYLRGREGLPFTYIGVQLPRWRTITVAARQRKVSDAWVGTARGVPATRLPVAFRTL